MMAESLNPEALPNHTIATLPYVDSVSWLRCKVLQSKQYASSRARVTWYIRDWFILCVFTRRTTSFSSDGARIITNSIGN